MGEGDVSAIARTGAARAPIPAARSGGRLELVVVLSPFALAVIWWSWADQSGYTTRQASKKMDERKARRLDEGRKGGSACRRSTSGAEARGGPACGAGTTASMLIHPQIDPVAPGWGRCPVHWYGLTYLAAFLMFRLAGRRRLRHPAYADLSDNRPGARATSRTSCSGRARRRAGRAHRLCAVLQAARIPGASAQGVLRSGRAGMSFHGGMPRRAGGDGLVRAQPPQVPAAGDRLHRALRADRAGGRPHRQLHQRRALGPGGRSPLPRGHGVPRRRRSGVRHPSQLYQSFALEGLLPPLLWLCARPGRTGEVSASSWSAMAACASAAEFFHEPDAPLGLLGLGLSMGSGRRDDPGWRPVLPLGQAPAHGLTSRISHPKWIRTSTPICAPPSG